MKTFLTIPGLSNNSLICRRIDEHRIYIKDSGGFMREGASGRLDPSGSIFRFFYNNYLQYNTLRIKITDVLDIILQENFRGDSQKKSKNHQWL